MKKLARQSERIDIGVLVLLSVFISLAAIALLPWAPQAAQTFWIVAMFCVAVGAALWYGGDREED